MVAAFRVTITEKEQKKKSTKAEPHVGKNVKGAQAPDGVRGERGVFSNLETFPTLRCLNRKGDYTAGSCDMTLILASKHAFLGVQDDSNHFFRRQVLALTSGALSRDTHALSQCAWSSPHATCSVGGNGLRAQGVNPERGLCI